MIYDGPSHLIWMDYSGSPSVLIPVSQQEKWLGFYHHQPEAGSRDTSPDLMIHQTPLFHQWPIDFERPITHYDQLCGLLETQPEDFAVTNFPNPRGSILGISSFYDQVAWCPALHLLINGKVDRIHTDLLPTLNWQTIGNWENPDDQVSLMNACSTPLDTALIEGQDFMPIFLPANRYSIEVAMYQSDFCAVLYRFKKN